MWPVELADLTAQCISIQNNSQNLMFKIKKSKGGSICGKGDVRLEKKKKYPPTKQCTYSCESCSGCNRQTDIRNQRSTPGHDLRSNSDLLAVLRTQREGRIYSGWNFLPIFKLYSQAQDIKLVFLEMFTHPRISIQTIWYFGRYLWAIKISIH